VTDRGLQELKELDNLTTLDLFLTPVTDVGLKELVSLKGLTFLNLAATKVTDTGVTEFKKALPRCIIQR
jgi:internalin A